MGARSGGRGRAGRGGGPVMESGGGAHVGGAGGAGGLPAWGAEEGAVGAGVGGTYQRKKPGPLPSICRRPVAVVIPYVGPPSNEGGKFLLRSSAYRARFSHRVACCLGVRWMSQVDLLPPQGGALLEGRSPTGSVSKDNQHITRGSPQETGGGAGRLASKMAP